VKGNVKNTPYFEQFVLLLLGGNRFYSGPPPPPKFFSEMPNPLDVISGRLMATLW
jgi:hypothetical protein